MISALAKALSQLSDPTFRKVFLLGLLSSFLAFTFLWVVASFGISLLAEQVDAWIATKDWWDWVTQALEWVVGAVSVATLLLVSFLLFPAAVLIILSFLLEPIARAVERRHYPGLPPARAQPVAEMIMSSLAFLGVTLLVNLVVLPLYLVPGINLILFYGVNGYLVGREFYEVVAFRRLDAKAAKALRRHHRGGVFLGGIVVAFMLTIPLVNLLSPLVATAFMLHLFEAQRQAAMR